MQLELKQICRGTKAEEAPTSPAPPLFYSHSLLFSNIQLGGEHLEGHYYKYMMEKMKLKCAGVCCGRKE